MECGSYGVQIWPLNSQSPFEQKPIKNFEEKGARAYAGTAQNFLSTPYYLRNGQSCELQIWQVHSQGKSEQELPKFYQYPLLSQEQVKLHTLNLAGTFAGSIRTKAHDKFGRKGSMGISKDCPSFLSTPIISGMSKVTNFKFCTHIHRIDRNKSPVKISAKVAMGVLRDSRKFSGQPYIWRIARSSFR